MYWHSRQWHSRGWRVGIALAGLILLLASLLSFEFYDPTLTNLRSPSAGVANLVGLPGALVGGSLVEFLGASSLWIPVLLANWLLIPARRRDLGPYFLFGGSAILFSATLHGLLSEATIPAISSPGLVGIAGSRWMLRATEISVAVPLLGIGLAFVLVQVLRLPYLHPALREIGTITLYLFRIPLARFQGWWRAISASSRAAARHLRQGLSLQGLSRLRLGNWINWGRGLHQQAPRSKTNPAMGARGQRPSAATGSEPGGSPGQSLSRPAGSMAGQDGFNNWISALGRPTPGAESADKP